MLFCYFLPYTNIGIKTSHGLFQNSLNISTGHLAEAGKTCMGAGKTA